MDCKVFPEQVQRRTTSLSLLVLATALACAAVLLAPALAGSRTYAPPSHKIWSGVSDTGDFKDFQSFSHRVRKHPAVLETFHRWGMNPAGKADDRWAAARARPMLHISTTASYGGPEVITPHSIAKGRGDDYLIRLNSYFGETRRIAYIRPFGEMNGCHNPYAAFNCGGSGRQWHSTSDFRRAWRRIVIILRGGGSLATINYRLRQQHLNAVRPDKESLPSSFPSAPVSFVWSPQITGDPNVRGNTPAAYFPGKRFVDWVGTDFYNTQPTWKGLNRFYKKWRHKPFALTEWGVTGSDNAKFARAVFSWARKHRRAKMLIYYRGFSNDRYDPSHYPKVYKTLRGKLRSSRFPPFTPENRASGPSGGAGP